MAYRETAAQINFNGGGQECPPHTCLRIVNPLVFTLYKTLLRLTDSLPLLARRALLITKEGVKVEWVKPPEERR